eukprot:s416_g10.t1
MGSNTSKVLVSTTSSLRSFRGAQADQGGEGAHPGLRKDCAGRPSSPQSQGSSMALHGDSHQVQASSQSMGPVDKLQHVRFARGVCAKEGGTCFGHSSTESNDGAAGFEGTTRSSTKRSSSRRSSGESGDRQGGGRREDDDTVGGVSTSTLESQAEGDEGTTGNDFSESWTSKCRSSKRLSTGSSDITPEINNKLGAGDTSAVMSKSCRRDRSWTC